MSFFKRSGQKVKNACKTASGFPSKLEEAVYNVLLKRQLAGEIKDIKRQVPVRMPCGIAWRLDFGSIDVETDKDQLHEAKGYETEVYRLKRRMYEGCPVLERKGNLEIWKGTYKNPILSTVISPSPVKE